MTDLNTQVSDAVEPEVVAPATNSGEGGVADATPATPAPSVDVEALKADYEKKLAAAQNDVNAVKSALQSRESAIQKQFAEERSALQKQLREIRMQGMDENQRKQYEQSLAAEEVEQMRSRLQETEQKNQQFAAMLDAQNFFLQQGVPVQNLDFTNYDALVASGWGAINAELARLREQVKNPVTRTPDPLKSAPSVVTDKGAPGGASTWKDLIAKYGSAENVYQLVESGNLNPSILPA
jgi:hypothetical protein